jgi:hypothetical protein
MSRLVAVALAGVLITPTAGSPAVARTVGGDTAMGLLAMANVRPSGKPVGGRADQVSISANGRYITYTSSNTKVAGQPRNGYKQVLRYDTRTGRTELVSATPAGTPGHGDSYKGAMSRDGRIVVFETLAVDLVGVGDPFTFVIVARDMTTAR